MPSRILLLFILASVSLSCSRNEPERKVIRSFYYWKTIFDLDQSEQKELRDAGTEKLYIRFFDVDWDEKKSSPVPVSHIRFNTEVNKGIQVIPTIFITNRTLQKLSDISIPELAGKISLLIKQLRKDTLLIKEVQLDCDWTESTSKKYFSLMNDVRRAFTGNVIISATIRLHQVKYFERTGVPPADRGMLMFYNMGKLTDSNTRNSIFDEATARAYLVNFSRYPLKLDVALPMFSWGAVFRKDKIADIMNDIKIADLEGSDMFTRTEDNRFKVNKSGYFRTYYLYSGDIVRIEEANEKDCKNAAKIIEPYLKSDSITVSIFHLDKNEPFFHDKEAQQDIYSVFH